MKRVAGAQPLADPEPKSSSDPTPPPHPLAQVVTSVAGSAAATVITSTFGASPWANLGAALVGAIVPVIVFYAPKHRHWRLGLMIAVVALAFALTYGGVRAVDAASGAKTFPDKSDVQTATGTGDDAGGSGSGSTSTGGGGTADAAVAPDSLDCTADGCRSPVTVESTGDGRVTITDIDVDGDPGFAFDGCEGRRLDPGESCDIEVTFTPEGDPGDRAATLEITGADDVLGRVRLTGTVGGPAGFDTTGETCSADGTTITFTITGPPGTVTVSTDPPTQVAVGAPLTLNLPPGGTAELTVDPDTATDGDESTVDVACP